MSATDRPSISVIVAALNEAGTIEDCVRRILAVYPGTCEVLVVAGGIDATADLVEAMATEHPVVRCIRNPDDRGKGHAIRTGIAHATAQIHAQIDADLQFLPEELPRLTDPIRRGEADVVLGTRFTAGSTRLPGSTPPIRTMGNMAISAFASLLFGQWMTDVQAGMKAWSAEAIHTIAVGSDNYSYEVEIPVKALRRGLRVVDVPITTDHRFAGATNVRVLAAGLALVRDITAFRLGWK